MTKTLFVFSPAIHSLMELDGTALERHRSRKTLTATARSDALSDPSLECQSALDVSLLGTFGL